MKLLYIQQLANWGVGLDTETFRITDTCVVPTLVCGSVAMLDPDAGRDGVGNPLPGKLLIPEEVCAVALEIFEDPERVMVGANLAFDLPVIARWFADQGRDVYPQIFKILEEGRVYDLQLAEALHAIAEGHLGMDPRTGRPLVNPETGRRGAYSLSMCVSLCLGRDDAKVNDEYRERYDEFHGVPHDQWPAEAKQYPVDDARNTVEVALAQTGHLPKMTTKHVWNDSGTCDQCGATKYGEQCVTRERHRNLCNLRQQVYAAFCLALNGGEGLMVDQTKVDTIEKYATVKRDNSIGPFVDVGLIRADGSENRALLKRKIAEAYGSAEPCEVCADTGKVAAPNPRQRQCPDCKGRSASWKSGGKIKDPTVAFCFTCEQTGKIPDPKHLVGCQGPDGEKTCDGTGLELAPGVPLAEKGGVAYGMDALHESGDDLLMSFGDFNEDGKWLDYVDYLRTAREPVDGHGPMCPYAHYVKGKRRLSCDCSGPWRDTRLVVRYDPMKETGRASARGKIHQFPRWPGFLFKKGTHEEKYIPSFRECVVPEKGWVLSSEDFKAGELVTHAESCHILVGFSDLGDVLLSRDSNGDPMDPHADLAALVLGVTYEEFIARKKEKRFSDTRQASKPQNFGKPTGMGSPKMVMQQRMQGEDTPHSTGPSKVDDGNGNLVPGYKGMRYCILMGGSGPCGGPDKTVMWYRDRAISPMCEECLQRCDELGEVWKKKWRENRPYSNHINKVIDHGQTITWDLLRRWPWLQEWYSSGEQLAPGEIMQHFVGRIRGGLTFTEASNSYFQAYLADITKAAYCQVTRECKDRTFRVPTQLYENSIVSPYAGMDSPLFGSRAPGFYHDEVFATHPEVQGADAAWRISEIMRDTMRWMCPTHADAAIAEPTLMGPWNKAAAKVIHGGKLVVWEPEHDPKKCLECKS